VTPSLYIKMGIAVLVLGIAAGLAYKVNSWRQDALELGAVRQEMAALKAAQAASQKASQGLQDELQNLRNTRKPAPAIRLCKPAKPVPEAGTGRDDSAPGTGELPQEAGPDIGTDLYGLADEADELAARLRACQALLAP
jgi:type II secretory pathway pseudopilin PulG